MKKKKIGKAFSKPIILGDENILMQGEFLLQLNGDGSGKSLKKRVGNKVVDVFTGISQQEIDEMENELQTQEQILLNIDAVQTLTLRGGWNWVSIYLNVEDEDDDIFGQLQEAIGDTCTTAQIKIQDKASTLSEGEWTGYDDFLQNGVGIQILVSDSCSVTLHGHYVTKRQPSPSKSGPFEYAYPYPFESQFSSIFQDAEVGDKIETLGDPDDEDSRVAAIFDGTEWVSQGDYDFNTFTPGIYYVYTPYVKPNPLGDDMHLAQMVQGTDYQTSEDKNCISLHIYKTSAWGQAIANGKLPLHIYNAEETLVASYTDGVGYTIQGSANPKNWSDLDTFYEMPILAEGSRI